MDKETFIRNTKPVGDCWIWTKCCSGGREGFRYGQLKVNGKVTLAHRYSYSLFNGAISDGLHVLHRCDVPSCVNPEHLFLGTNTDNIADSVNKNRRKGITRNRPSGLKYNYSDESKARWLESKRKIKLDDRVKILDEYKSGGCSQRLLADKYGVKQSTINRIIHDSNLCRS